MGVLRPWVTLRTMWPYWLGSEIMRSSRQYWTNRIWSQLTSQPFNSYVRHTLYCPRGLRLRCFVDCVCLLATDLRRNRQQWGWRGCVELSLEQGKARRAIEGGDAFDDNADDEIWSYFFHAVTGTGWRKMLGEHTGTRYKCASTREMLGDVGTILWETISINMVARMKIQGWCQLTMAVTLISCAQINILLNSTRAHNFNDIINDTTFLLLATVCLLRTLQLSGATLLPPRYY